MLTACHLHNICMLHTNISLCVKSSEFLQLTEAKDFRKSCLSSLKHFYMISITLHLLPSAKMIYENNADVITSSH